MNKRSNSSLFLMEQLIVILIFAICAAACIKIFVDAYFTTNQAHDLSNALLIAESGAEGYKAVGGDAAQLAEVLGGGFKDVAGQNAVYVYYNADWQVCGETEAEFALVIAAKPIPAEPFAPLYADLLVEKTTGEELIAFTVAAGGKQHE